MTNSVRAALAVSVLCAAATQAMAGGQICAPSNAVNQRGIGDGCTTEIAGYIFPEIGIFRSTFTPACDRHDKCYTTLGSTYSSCDGQFLSDMRSACKSSFNPLFFPVEYSACYATATEYYVGIQGYADIYDPLPGFQLDARARSKTMATSVEADTCGTTPERTTLYTSSLISKVNGAFQTNAGRLPTIYEFFVAVNAGTDTTNYVTSPAWWESNLTTYSLKQAAFKPPIVTYTKIQSISKVVLSTPVTNVGWLWKANGTTSTTSSIAFATRMPQYDLSWKIEGFLKLVDNTPAHLKNMKVIDETVYEQGLCRDVPGGPCF
jgi:hypothetical protein